MKQRILWLTLAALALSAGLSACAWWKTPGATATPVPTRTPTRTSMATPVPALTPSWTATATPAPALTPAGGTTPTPSTPMAVPPLDNSHSSTQVSIPEIGLELVLPAGWLQTEQWMWSPAAGDARHVGVNWAARQGGFEPTALLPNHSVSTGAQPLDLSWGQGTAYTVEIYDSAAQGGKLVAVETHVIVLTEGLIYDLFASAPSADGLAALQPVLDGMLASAHLVP